MYNTTNEKTVSENNTSENNTSEINTSEINKNRLSLRSRATLIGILILVAYGTISYAFGIALSLVLVFELISGGAVLGAAVLLFPILKPYGKTMTWAYTIIKFVEGFLILISAFLLIPKIIDPSLSATQLLKNRDSISLAIEYLFGLRFLLLAILYFKSKLIPRFISIWGIIAAMIVLIGVIVNLIIGKELIPDFVSLPLVILNEIFLAFWLMIKGFSLENRN